MDTVKVTINGRELTVEKGRSVLQASIENGIELPYYCYHPGLGVDGSCRVCIVKIEKMPKLQTSCSTLCTDGMVVHTQTPDVVEARAGVFEFLLINHPLDCPVCDKGGECPLQDFSYAFGPDRSRMEFPRRTFDGEGVEADVDFGPTLMLNRNRCILCTRCIRFMRDIDNDAQIGVTDRGAGSEISTYKEEGVHSLLSGNLMDVCPVGAITTRDYRFKSRPWDNPLAGDTICTFCSKGCNTTVWIKAKPEWARGAQMARVTPRLNPEVNSYWMCDIGRFDYHWVEGDRRLVQPLVRASNGVQQPVNWHDVWRALREPVAQARDGFQILTSAHASLEELHVLKQLSKGLGAPISVTYTVTEKKQPEGTKFKVPAANAPNLNGARDLGLNVPADNAMPPDLSELRRSVEGGQVKALYVFDPGPPGSLGDVSWIVSARESGRLPLLIVHGVVHSELTAAADCVMPGSTSFEKDASYTNDKGMVQGAATVIAAPGDAQDDCSILSNFGMLLGLTVSTPERARTEIATELIHLQAYGALQQMRFSRPVPLRTWLQMSNPSERWKWDHLFQDLPPVKGALDPNSLPPAPPTRPGEGGAPRVISLKPVD
ncbi:MAG TPA: 2Fe-2S iron-sulfur cluster-binding protein [Vicinamibacterales bacterium]|nr:2Fe-2S iron-sulfur cluster-binding protein [Vicinamibacterales bacterium]